MRSSVCPVHGVCPTSGLCLESLLTCFGQLFSCWRSWNYATGEFCSAARGYGNSANGEFWCQIMLD